MPTPYSYSDPAFLSSLEEIYGIDLSFDLGFNFKGVKDVVANQGNNDFDYVAGPLALAQELQRMFDLSPKGSCLGDSEDLSYGIDWDFIGQPNNPEVMTGLVKVAVYQALQHPSFQARFRVAALDTYWQPESPNAISVTGILEVFGFEQIDYVRFGPFAIRYITG